jgi:hypothetical protein
MNPTLLVAMVAALGVAGCVAPARAVPVRGPDGDPNWVSISCKGDPTDCEVLAGQSCPSGYDVGSTSYQGIPRAPSKGSATGVSGATPTMGGGHVLVKCHGRSFVNMPIAPESASKPADGLPPTCQGSDCRPHEVEDPSVSGAQRPE